MSMRFILAMAYSAKTRTSPKYAAPRNIKFIGPPPEVTRMMGEKSTARQTMKKAKVPILPGFGWRDRE